ncbi:MAG: hypothetical protein LUD50_06470 [Clostridia bacterium]|nr:hypothetical protein [Clostridia bacterium]
MSDEELNGFFRLEQCMLQAEVFGMSAERGYDSKAFIRGFMRSETAKYLDADFSRMQNEVPAYIMETLEDEDRKYVHPGVCFPLEEMQWAGYLYRLWHLTTGETSREIYRQASATVVHSAYSKYRTLDGHEVIRILKDAYAARQEERKAGRKSV